MIRSLFFVYRDWNFCAKYQKSWSLYLDVYSVHFWILRRISWFWISAISLLSHWLNANSLTSNWLFIFRRPHSSRISNKDYQKIEIKHWSRYTQFKISQSHLWVNHKGCNFRDDWTEFILSFCLYKWFKSAVNSLLFCNYFLEKK